MNKLNLMLAAVAVFAASAQAEPVSPEVLAEYNKLMAEAAALRADHSDTWMTERRTEEIKTLVREVLSDAETRASLMDSAVTAGHNGQNFFLASEDGSFLLKIDGQIQFRYIVNFADDDDSGTSSSFDEGEAGFVLARTKLQFSGHIADPKLHYAVRLAVDRENNTVSADRITIGYDLTDNLYLWFGEDTAPFLREEMIDSSRQLAVERSHVNEIFTLDKVQGVGVIWDPTDDLKVQAMIHDGARSGDGDTSSRYFLIDRYLNDNISSDSSSKDFDDDGVDFGIVARLDWLIMGDWAEWNDFTSFPGAEEFAYVGAAINYEANETGASGSAATSSDDVLSWTVDAGYENNGWSFYAAYVGLSVDRDSGSTASDADVWGVLAQGSYNIALDNGDSLEPFVRWERADFEDDGESDVGDIDMVTVGANWYHKKHQAKFTLDVVIVINNLEDEVELLGVVETDDGSPIEDNNQYAIRAQYQLLF